MQFSNRTQGKHPDNNSESEGIEVDQIEISKAQVVYFHACEGSKDMQTKQDHQCGLDYLIAYSVKNFSEISVC